jgi:hypothetical protein
VPLDSGLLYPVATAHNSNVQMFHEHASPRPLRPGLAVVLALHAMKALTFGKQHMNKLYSQ